MPIWPPQKKVVTVGFITGGVAPIMVNFVWPAAQQPQKKIFPAAAFQKIIPHLVRLAYDVYGEIFLIKAIIFDAYSSNSNL